MSDLDLDAILAAGMIKGLGISGRSEAEPLLEQVALWESRVLNRVDGGLVDSQFYLWMNRRMIRNEFLMFLGSTDQLALYNEWASTENGSAGSQSGTRAEAGEANSREEEPIAAMACSAHAGDFSNLGFDQGSTNGAMLNLVQCGGDQNCVEGFGPAEELLPGWQVLRGTGLVTNVNKIGFNSVEAWGGVSLFEKNNPTLMNSFAIQGPYAVALDPISGGNMPLAIEQHGIVPASATTFQFTYWGSTFPTVQIDGNTLDPFYSSGVLPTLPTLFKYDVSHYSGQEITLELIARPQGGGLPPGTLVVLDSLAFVPEPNSLWLLSLGAAALCIANGRRGKQRP